MSYDGGKYIFVLVSNPFTVEICKKGDRHVPKAYYFVMSACPAEDEPQMCRKSS